MKTISINALLLGCIFLFTAHFPGAAAAQDRPDSAKAKPKQSTPAGFHWVNELSAQQKSLPVQHHTFTSPSMKIDVGYCIYLPPGYDDAKNADTRYPVVYYLHGGRPGSETKSIGLSTFIDDAMRAKKVPPAIYVFINGGPVSHYNYPQIDNGMGEDVFIQELIPHIDKTYRTIAQRKGRAIEGFSQGGRGTTRIMFKHPHLFCSAAPGGAGHSTELRISEEGGKESESLIFAPGYNTYDLAREYAKGAKDARPSLRILIHVGTKGFNYENNLAYMKFLESLEIPFDKLIVEDAPHSAKVIYEKNGLDIMKFHAESFRLAASEK